MLQRRESKGLQKTRPSFADTTGERRGVAPGSFVDLLVNATDKATGESLSDLERTNQAFVMVMSGDYPPIAALVSEYVTAKAGDAHVRYLTSRVVEDDNSSLDSHQGHVAWIHRRSGLSHASNASL